MKKNKSFIIKQVLIATLTLGSFLVYSPIASAHVIVKPSQVGEAVFQEFSMAVPSEKDMPTTAVKLIIPDGLKYVSPNVKPGWIINVVKQGTGEDAKVTEIDWVNGSIPSGQRDDFIFQAQSPAKETTLHWKAYQTYEDGSTVAWDNAPSKDPEDDAAPPPYSQTVVMNDLKHTPMNNAAEGNNEKNSLQATNIFSSIALITSFIAIFLVVRKKQTDQ